MVIWSNTVTIIVIKSVVCLPHSSYWIVITFKMKGKQKNIKIDFFVCRYYQHPYDDLQGIFHYLYEKHHMCSL